MDASYVKLIVGVRRDALFVSKKKNVPKKDVKKRRETIKFAFSAFATSPVLETPPQTPPFFNV